MAMVRGKAGSGRLRAPSKRPSASSRRLSCSNASLERAQPLGLEQLDDQLVFSAGGVDVEAAEGEHLHAVLQIEAHPPAPAPEQHRAELGHLVLQGEVGMPRAGRAEIADLPLHPDGGKSLLELRLDPCRQLGDRPHRPLAHWTTLPGKREMTSFTGVSRYCRRVDRRAWRPCVIALLGRRWRETRHREQAWTGSGRATFARRATASMRPAPPNKTKRGPDRPQDDAPRAQAGQSANQ